MKIKYKITIGMICLLSLLFGIGGTILINASFQDNLKREKDAAISSYQMVMNTLQILDHAESWGDINEAVDDIEQLLEQDIPKWSGVRLRKDNQIIYKKNALEQADMGSDIDTDPDIGEFYLSSFTDRSGRHHLYLTGVYPVSGEILRLDTARDISEIYIKHNKEINFFRIIYIILVVICAALSLFFSWVLTKPLSKLSEATKEIASGDLTSRSRIEAGDEIGFLSKEFDNMAEQTEKNILDMEASIKRQERFIGNFTHEIKTPVAAIIGFSDLLRSKALSEDEQISAASYILSESKRLENLSLKMLDIFVAENEEIERIPVHMRCEIDNILESMKTLLDEKKIHTVNECDEGYFTVDTDLFHSLITNLLTNAVNAMENGGCIEIKCRIFSDRCTLSIKDDAGGIPAEVLGHITEEFYRADMSRSRKHGGAGLGLSLCARIANLHGGSISIKSVEGKGTLVKVVLKERDNEQ